MTSEFSLTLMIILELKLLARWRFEGLHQLKLNLTTLTLLSNLDNLAINRHLRKEIQNRGKVVGLSSQEFVG